MRMILFIIKKYAMLTIISIYFLINNGYVVSTTYTSILSILSLISLYHAVNMRGIYTTPDLFGLVLLEILIIMHTL